MLQIVTKMYFTEGADTHDTVHRCILYTNGRALLRPPFQLPVGELAPTTSMERVSSLTLTVSEHIEKQSDESRPGELISTGGDELVADIAAVLSFAWNLTVSTSADLVARLVPDTLNPRSFRFLTGTFSRTFDPDVVITDAVIADANEFIRRLLALHRSHYETVMRAIRRLITAMRTALEDPTMAYTDIVAALESLSAECSCHPATSSTSVTADTAPDTRSRPSWGQIDGGRRRIIDAALESLDESVVGQIRAAILDGEKFGAKSRFVDFVLSRLSLNFYGLEAADALQPVRRPDTERLLRHAYDVRSQHVHSLHQLPREASDITMRAETVTPPGEHLMLTLEGLARLARHVIRTYVDRAPTDLDTTFEWSKSLPGRYEMRLAPEYWLHNGPGFSAADAPRYLEGLIESVVAIRSGHAKGIVDMTDILTKIERDVRGLAASEAKTTMIAIYELWHRVMHESVHRPGAEVFLKRHKDVLAAPTMQIFAIDLLTQPPADWTVEQWQTLASTRLASRAGGSAAPLPPGFDAALHLILVDKLLESDRSSDALMSARNALGELPGDPQLVELAAALIFGGYVDVDIQELLFGPSAGREGPSNESCPIASDGSPTSEHASEDSQ